MQYSRELDDLEPVFDDCPTVCHYYGDGHKGPKFCDACDRGDLRTQYIDDTTADLGGDRRAFEAMSAAVSDALVFEGLPADRLTIPAAEMVSIIEAERERIRRVKAWQTKQTIENAGK